MSLSIHQTLSQLASQCVMCGLCIPHCPTYQLFKTESESPRGRIALYKALADEQLDMTPGLNESLDHCLGCQACEKMCPSQVDYASISLLGKELVASHGQSGKRPVRQVLAEKLLITPSLHPLLKLSAKALAPIQQLISHQSRQSPLGNYTHAIADDTSGSPSLKHFYPRSSPERADPVSAKGQVILFKGCSGDLFEQQTLADSATLLNACGYNVLIPEKQQCCGAIKIRSGDTQGMIALAKQSIANFGPHMAETCAIISVNNSCSGQLKAFAQLTTYTELEPLSGAEQVSRKTSDIIAFLAEALKSNKTRFMPLQQEVMVHIPCSLKNVLKEERLLFQLLELIPGIRLVKLNDKFCCGAAGSYMLHYPDVANRLLDDKIKEIKQLYTDNAFARDERLIVSSNLGCTLHFKQGLEKLGQTVEVIHPVRLLARQLAHKD